MPRIFLSNFHFEHELADSRFVPTRKLLEINARNALSWLKLAQAGDVIVLPQVGVAGEIAARIREMTGEVGVVVGDDLPRGNDWVATPWGWTHSMVRLAEKQRWVVDAPAIEAVTSVNSRRFAFVLEKETGLQPEPSALAGSLEDVKQFISSRTSNGGWLIKGEFGMSGRERIRVEGEELNASQLGWLKREFTGGRVVVIEPMLERVDEVSVHYDVKRDGVAERVGIVALTSDVRGQFAQAVVGSESEQASWLEEWSAVLTHTDHAAAEASRRGYVGPLGSDVMRFVNDSKMVMRPLQDINARWTMGRLALEDES